MIFQYSTHTNIKDQIKVLAESLKSLEDQPKLTDNDEVFLNDNLKSFSHTTFATNLKVAGVSSNGDYPVLRCGNNFIYHTLADCAVYVSDAVVKLKEIPAESNLINAVTSLAKTEKPSREIDQNFEQIADVSVIETIENSDYRELKSAESRRNNSTDLLYGEMIRPSADDTGNISVQLKSVGLFGMVLSLIKEHRLLDYILLETTFSLPSVTLPTGSLFYEHLKRLCCVEARKRGIKLLTLTKNHGIFQIHEVEQSARQKQGLPETVIAEHWYLRLPIFNFDKGSLSFIENRRFPPAGAVSYLVRFHRTFPTMRLDMDRDFWMKTVRGKTENETTENERKIFEDLDYLCHEQSSYGFPYPLKSSRDKTTLSNSARGRLRKLIIDELLKSGVPRSSIQEFNYQVAE
jgi:hypothetical protein